MKKLSLITTFLIAIISLTYAQKTDILTEGFEDASLPAGWTNIYGAGDNDNWTYQTGGANGGAYPETAHTGTYNAFFRGYPYPSVTKLVTPALNLSNGGILNFWWASHTYLGAGNIDLLTVYYKDGFMGEWIQLASYPEGADNWTEATFNLPISSEIYVAFEGSYDGGMGVCIDDVHIFNSDTDLGIDNVTPILAFGTDVNPTVKIHNYGLIEASTYTVTVTIDGTAYNEVVTANETIAPGEETIIVFPTWTLPAEETYEITATVEITGDALTDNNTMTINCVVDQTPIGNLLGYFDAGQTSQFAYPETDGENIYITKWYSNQFAKYSMNGNPIGDYFQISDILANDLTYDGQYFYTGKYDGGDGYSTVHQLDLENETVVGTFTTTAYANNLAYNNITGAFWGNSYDHLIQEFDHDGITSGEYFYPPENLSALAIDIYTDPTSPTIWQYQSGAANVVEQLTEFNFDGTATGNVIPINATQFPGIVDNNDQAGGLACYVNDQNQVVLLVGVQNLHDTYDGRILSVYIGEATTTYSVTITIIDEQTLPIEGATVEIGATKYSATTDENGQVTFNLIDNTYEYIVTKDCYTASYGSFEVSGGTLSVDNISLSSVNAPMLINAVVLTNGLTIEATFDNEMDLNGQSAPAGFAINVEETDFTITNVELKAGNNNIIVLTVENFIQTDEVVTFSYTAGSIQSVCEIELEDITDESVTNNSTVLVSINEIGNITSIYPNPVSDYLFVESNNAIENITIIDMLGKTIFKDENINSKILKIDISNFESGIYFIKVNNNIYSEKLIIQ